MIAEKKAVCHILDYKNGCKQYVVKFYPASVKQSALQYYMLRENQNVVNMEMTKDFSHSIILITIMTSDTNSKIRWLAESFCQSKEHTVFMFDMNDYFAIYKIMKH